MHDLSVLKYAIMRINNANLEFLHRGEYQDDVRVSLGAEYQVGMRVGSVYGLTNR